MADVGRDGWRIHHEVLGPADGRPVVLISGLGEQIGSVEFPEEHCLVFADAGWRVVRLDNRDSGLSVPDVDPGPPDWPAIKAALARGEQPEVPYALATLADDVIAVLDDLGVDAAALVGASMGAIAVLRYAVTDADLAGVVSVSSPAAWRVPRTARSLLAAGLTRTAPGRWVAARRLKLRISPRWSNPERLLTSNHTGTQSMSHRSKRRCKCTYRRAEDSWY